MSVVQWPLRHTAPDEIAMNLRDYDDVSLYLYQTAVWWNIKGDHGAAKSFARADVRLQARLYNEELGRQLKALLANNELRDHPSVVVSRAP